MSDLLKLVYEVLKDKALMDRSQVEELVHENYALKRRLECREARDGPTYYVMGGALVRLHFGNAGENGDWFLWENSYDSGGGGGYNTAYNSQYRGGGYW